MDWGNQSVALLHQNFRIRVNSVGNCSRHGLVCYFVITVIEAYWPNYPVLTSCTLATSSIVNIYVTVVRSVVTQ